MDYKRTSKKYEALWNKYKSFSQSINDSCTTFVNLDEIGIIDNENKNKIKNLFKKILKKIEKIDEDCQENDNIIFEIQKYARDIKNILTQEWDRYVTNKLNGYINMVNVLKKVFDVGELVMVKNYLDLRKNDFPITKQIIWDFKKKEESFEFEINKYKINKNIKKFLVKIGRNEATLDDLDDEILSWFNRMEINNHIKLSLE